MTSYFGDVDNVCRVVYEQVRDSYAVEHVSIRCAEDLLKCKDIVDLSDQQQEHFNVVTLSTAAEVIKVHNITKGLLNHSLVHPREVFRVAILDNAHSIICVHNHPSGNVEPSNQDLEITKQLVESGKILGVEVLDHVIVTKSGVTSLRSLGYF